MRTQLPRGELVVIRFHAIRRGPKASVNATADSAPGHSMTTTSSISSAVLMNAGHQGSDLRPSGSPFALSEDSIWHSSMGKNLPKSESRVTRAETLSREKTRFYSTFTSRRAEESIRIQHHDDYPMTCVSI